MTAIEVTDEMLDDAKCRYAVAWATMTDVADRISVLAHEGALSAEDRDHVHDQLRRLFEHVEQAYTVLDKDGYDEDGVNRYSDGSAVWDGGFAAIERYPADAVYCGGLGWADELIPGTVVVVHEPPHRMSVAQ